jgi:hypothetical protein
LCLLRGPDWSAPLLCNLISAFSYSLPSAQRLSNSMNFCSKWNLSPPL